MKKYPLSTSAERTVGILFSFAMIAALALLLYALRGNLTYLLLIGLCVLLVSAILILYVLNVGKAACVYDPQTDSLKVVGFRDYTIDLNKVACIQTIAVKTGQVESRSIAFTDSEGAMVAVVPTYFTSKRGVMAEPMAKQMAADMGIEFQENVPAWEYDDEARKIHDAEVIQQEKEEAKARREGKKKLMQAKIRKRMAEMQEEETK
jgi:hypothetical protein